MRLKRISNLKILVNRDFQGFPAVEACRKVKAIIFSVLIIFKIETFLHSFLEGCKRVKY